MRRLVDFTFNFGNANPEFVRLVMIENIHRGRHLAQSLRASEMTRPIIEQFHRVLARGVETDSVRSGVDAVELHVTLSSLCFFFVSNRHTFEYQFDYDEPDTKTKSKRKAKNL